MIYSYDYILVFLGQQCTMFKYNVRAISLGHLRHVDVFFHLINLFEQQSSDAFTDSEWPYRPFVLLILQCGCFNANGLVQSKIMLTLIAFFLSEYILQPLLGRLSLKFDRPFR